MMAGDILLVQDVNCDDPEYNMVVGWITDRYVRCPHTSSIQPLSASNHQQLTDRDGMDYMSAVVMMLRAGLTVTQQYIFSTHQ
jgi:hypothetical protein